MSLINPDVMPEKDFPLRDDIRLLGRLLGDTIREQEGEAAFDIVELIRQTSIRFHRNEDQAARRERVERLRREVQAGRYQVDLGEVAEALIRQVELTRVPRPAPRAAGEATGRPHLAVAA